MSVTFTCNVIRAVCTSVAVVGVIVAMTKPLVWVEKTYPVHLFPNHEEFDYRVSRLHEHSQNLHIATGVFLSELLLIHVWAVCRAHQASAFFRRMSFWIHFSTLILYLASLCTLIQVGKHVKDQIDDFPIPLPHVRVDMAAGSYMDIVGFGSLLASFGASMMLDLATDEGYEPIV